MAPNSRRRHCTLPLVWEQPTFQLTMDGSTDLIEPNIVYTAILGENKSIDPESSGDWKTY
jgi:hypothetical protein